MNSIEPAGDDFVTVAKVGAIPEGEGRSFQVGDRLIAVFLHRGQYMAIDDLCPHMGASLGGGYLDDEGVVTCPWHAWRFCVRDGKWADNPRLAVDTFDVRVARRSNSSPPVPAVAVTPRHGFVNQFVGCPGQRPGSFTKPGALPQSRPQVRTIRRALLRRRSFD